MPIHAAVTDIQYIDPLSFKTISIGDRVHVLAPSGAVVDLEVQTISDDGTILMGPLNQEEEIKANSKDTLVLAAKFFNRNGFSVNLNDTVTILNHSGRKIQRTVDSIVGKDFLILTIPGNKEKMGLLKKMKFVWDTIKR